MNCSDKRTPLLLRHAVHCLIAAVVLLAVLGCRSAVPALRSSAGLLRAGGSMVTIEEQPVPMAPGQTTVLTPHSPGAITFTGGGATIDASNASEGYITASYSGGASKIKLQLTRAGGKTYTYNLSPTGAYEVFPLTSGNGSYTVGIYENVTGTQYAAVLTANVDVALRNGLLPFLYPNQFVNFNAGSAAVAKGAALAAGAQDEVTVVANVYNFVVGNIVYDTQKAATVKSGYLPAVDSILASGKGICFDYAALMASMLRSQNIPTRLEVGYVSGGLYHAWISVYIQNVGWVNQAIYFDGQNWKLMDPTFASSANQSASIMQYIGNGSNYSTQFVY